MKCSAPLETIPHMLWSLGQAAPELRVFARGKVAATQIFDMVDRKPVICSSDLQGHVGSTVSGKIEFRKVNFHYPSRASVPILRDLSLTIPAGQTFAIVGKSGSGKSTVLSLIERFYDPTSGEILFDEKDIKCLQLRWYRMQISLVSQEPVLFATSIRENILYGRPDATDEEIEAAATISNVHTFISNLPEGYGTQVGVRGVQLSGGEKQRVAIARALLRKPSVLLLDEATSALDAESEQLVQDALECVSNGCTTVVVAHRLSTIRKADQIAVFDGGEISEIGSHEQLCQNGTGHYRSLVYVQESEMPLNFHDRSELPAARSADQLSLNPQPNENPQRDDISPKFQVPAVDAPLKVDAAMPCSAGVRSQKKRRTLEEHTIIKLCKLAAQDWLAVLLGSLGAALAGSLNPLFYLFLMEIVSDYYSQDTAYLIGMVGRWFHIFMSFGIIAFLSSGLQHFFYGSLGQIISNKMQQNAFKVILKNEISWFDDEKNGSPAITTSLASNSSLLRMSVSESVSSLVQYAASISLAIVIAFQLQWKMAAVTVVTFPIAMIGGSFKKRFFKKGFTGDLDKLYEKANDIAGQGIANIRTVAAFCAEKHVLKLFNKELDEPMKETLINAQKAGASFGLSQFALFSTNVLGIWYISVLVKRDHLSFVNPLKAFQVLAWTGYYLAEALDVLPDISRGLVAASALFKFIDYKTKIDPENPDGTKLKQLMGNIELENVTFSYLSRPTSIVLSDINLKIRDGSTTALVGPSGSGKSSIISLIERFYDPTGGRILLDGIDIRCIQLHWLRSQIGLVQQEPVLFGTSIRENILYGKDDASEMEVVNAAKAAFAHEFISSLPQGYDTHVGEQGAQLSGGQKQRIAIARALIRNPRIMLLDEATSALDTASERVVQLALDGMIQGNCTTVVVAHRLSTIRDADLIVVLQCGRIMEQGTHDELLTQGGIYANLYQKFSN